jgi:hypothetical protein
VWQDSVPAALARIVLSGVCVRTLGIRAKPGEVTFAVYDSEARALLNVEVMRIPKALPTPDALKYVRNSILDVIREFDIHSAGIRVTESNAQTLSLERVQIEGVIQEAFASSCLKSYYSGQIASISRRVGFLRTQFKRFVSGDDVFDPIENWDSLTVEAREAVLAALGAEHA